MSKEIYAPPLKLNMKTQWYHESPGRNRQCFSICELSIIWWRIQICMNSIIIDPFYDTAAIVDLNPYLCFIVSQKNSLMKRLICFVNRSLFFCPEHMYATDRKGNFMSFAEVLAFIQSSYFSRKQSGTHLHVVILTVKRRKWRSVTWKYLCCQLLFRRFI